MYKVDNAIIMAAGTSSRFAPISYEKPKALIEVKGEILIERQIRQLKEAGIQSIYIVVGYKKEQFKYLEEKFGVILVENNDYLTRNNNASIYAVKDILKNSYICSSDNYFNENPFEQYVDDSYYSAVYAKGLTKEWCLETNEEDVITSVQVGGENAWYMLGHTFWSEEFSSKFIEILNSIYDLDETKNLLWESIYIQHLDELSMKIRKYTDGVIFEFDTFDELREFDTDYVENTHSKILKSVSLKLNCKEKDIVEVLSYKDINNAASGFTFKVDGKSYKYSYEDQQIQKIV